MTFSAIPGGSRPGSFESTPGFVSSDFHVHGIRSADSRVSDRHRVESYTAEGVENVVMTDHHQHSDLVPQIVEMGMEEKMTPEDQHGGYSHPTLHSTSSDPTIPSATLLGDSV